ncbi:MAG: type II secretion system protein GspL [Halioglobus sp.]
MLDSTIIRMIDGRLVWYPVGADQGPQALDSPEAQLRIQQLAGSQRNKLCFAVPGTDVSIFKVDFDAAEKKHIAKALPFALEEQLISDIDELHFSIGLETKTRLCAAVCSQRAMEFWQNKLQEFPTATQWIPEPLMLPWQSGEWTLVLEHNYAIVRTGNCEGFSIERSLLSGMLLSALQEREEPLTAVVVYGQDQAEDEDLLPESVRDISQWRRGDFGAAQMLHQDENVMVNLLQGAYGQSLPLRHWWQQWRTVAALLLGAFCLQLIASYASYQSLARENVELRTDIQKSYRRAFPEGALVDPEKQVRRKLESLQGSSQSSGFSRLMNDVGEIVASKPGTQIASLNYNEKGGEMRMNIVASDFETVEAIRIAMMDRGLDAVMENSNAQGDKVRARLRVGGGQ